MALIRGAHRPRRPFVARPILGMSRLYPEAQTRSWMFRAIFRPRWGLGVLDALLTYLPVSLRDCARVIFPEHLTPSLVSSRSVHWTKIHMFKTMENQTKFRWMVMGMRSIRYQQVSDVQFSEHEPSPFIHMFVCLLIKALSRLPIMVLMGVTVGKLLHFVVTGSVDKAYLARGRKTHSFGRASFKRERGRGDGR